MLERPEQKSILVVEDHESIRQLLEAVYEVEGYQVVSFGEPESAYDYFVTNHGNKIDLVSLDILMPGIDGIEFARRVRSIDPSTPIVFVSAYLDRDDAEKLIAESERPGNQPIKAVLKPFTVSELLEVVKKELYPEGSKENPDQPGQMMDDQPQPFQEEIHGKKPMVSGEPDEVKDKKTIVRADIKCYYCGYVSGTIEANPSEPVKVNQFHPVDSNWHPRPGDKLRCRCCGGPVYLDNVHRLRRDERKTEKGLSPDPEKL